MVDDTAQDDYHATAKRLVAITKRLDELTDSTDNPWAQEIKELIKEHDRIVEDLKVLYTQVGRQGDNIDGRNISLRVDTYASPLKLADGAVDIDVFREHGLGDLVKPDINAQTLRGWVIGKRNDAGLRRATDGNGNLTIPTIPPELAEHINIYDKIDIRVSKSSWKGALKALRESSPED